MISSERLAKLPGLTCAKSYYLTPHLEEYTSLRQTFSLFHGKENTEVRLIFYLFTTRKKEEGLFKIKSMANIFYSL